MYHRLIFNQPARRRETQSYWQLTAERVSVCFLSILHTINFIKWIVQSTSLYHTAHAHLLGPSRTGQPFRNSAVYLTSQALLMLFQKAATQSRCAIEATSIIEEDGSAGENDRDRVRAAIGGHGCKKMGVIT